jgi:tetratricopeptide (TPR) repeat protein
MAYNKSKHVEAAQKLLNQGKVPQAIAEYQHILKYEPKDQVTLMTIGELYIRQGETFQAIDYFERLAQIFVADGFLTKAIAVYKRIAKLAPEEIRPLERLADLYVQQGVMSEARPLFLQLAEIHLKNNRQAEAVALLKKLLLAEPDNLRIQIRLADLYQAMNQNADAIETYVSAAQRALARGDYAECEKLADKALKIDPASLAAVTIKARSQTAQGNLEEAAQLLKNLPGLEKGGEQSEFLLDIYLKEGNWDEASRHALRVFEADEKNFGLAQRVAEAMLDSGQTDRAMELIGKLRVPMIDAGEHDAIGRMLNDLATRTPGRIEPLEWLVDTYGRTSDSFRLPDALAQLGDAYAAQGDFERAKEVLEKLVDREPESDSAKRKLNEVLRKMGAGSAPSVPEHAFESLQAEIPQPEAPKIRQDEELPVAATSLASPAASEPAAAASAEEELDDETQKFIAQSLTDVDLFASYGLTQKAIGLLEAILRRAPRHTPTLEKLLDFVLGAGDDRRTAELASQLEQIHRERGDSRGAERFGELRRRFQRAAGISDEELAASPAATAPPPAGATPVAAAPVPEAGAQVEAAPAEPPAPAPAPEAAEIPSAKPEEVHEVDLSDEWATMLEPQGSFAAPPAAEKSKGKISAAPPAPGAPSVEEFEIPVEITSPEEQEPQPTPPVREQPLVPEPTPVSAKEVAPPRPPLEADQPPPAAQPEPEFELDQEYELVVAPEPLVPAYDQKPPAPVPQDSQGMASDQFLADLANEIDQLGIGQLTPAFSEPAAPTDSRAPAAPASPVEQGPLKEVFDEFRAELGEMGAEDEDLETHYNLGIAFREMGLLEEAISEFQKVAKANDRGKAFRYAMQCCTLLGLSFMEKGQPAIAAIWYERALRTPGLDAESALALRYDLGVAQESAGDSEAALKCFAQVYAVNIDYRDVAERIASLQKTAR